MGEKDAAIRQLETRMMEYKELVDSALVSYLFTPIYWYVMIAVHEI